MKARKKSDADPYCGAQLAAAAAAKDRAGIARTLRSVAAEAGDGSAAPAIAQARVLAAVACAMESAARGGVSTLNAWESLPSLMGASSVAAAVKVLLKLQPEAQDPMEAELLALIRDRLAEPPSLAEAAAALGLNATTMTKRLQRRYGVGYSGYVARLRLARAKELLRDTQLSLAQIARRVGISDPANLNRLFKRFEGVAPSTYRESHGRKK